jgi:hypothetical protein
VTEQEKWDRLLRFFKWLLGAIAVVAVFLLASPDANLPVAVKVALGAYLAFAAYANPASLVRVAAPELTERANAEQAAIGQPVRQAHPNPDPLQADEV